MISSRPPTREGSTLSSTVRNAWDGVPLRARIKASRLHVEAHHVSVMGHVARDELQRKLTAAETANGFANRFLWVHTYRARLLAPWWFRVQSRRRESDWGQRLCKARHHPDPTYRAGAAHRAAAEPNGGRRSTQTITDERVPGPDRRRHHEPSRGVRAPTVAAVRRSSTAIATLIDLPHLEAAWALWRYCGGLGVAHTGETPPVTRTSTSSSPPSAVPGARTGLSFTEACQRVFGKHRKVAPDAARAVRYGLLWGSNVRRPTDDPETSSTPLSAAMADRLGGCVRSVQSVQSPGPLSTLLTLRTHRPDRRDLR